MLRITRSVLSLDSLKMISYAYFHSVTMHGLVLWGNATQNVNKFNLQQRIIRIIIGARPEDSCREYVTTLQILPLVSQYILSIVLFMTHNKDLLNMDSEIHSFSTRGNTNFFQPMTNLKMCQKGPCHSGFKVYNNLPLEVRKLSDNVKLM